MDLVAFTEEILNEKLKFVCSVSHRKLLSLEEKTPKVFPNGSCCLNQLQNERSYGQLKTTLTEKYDDQIDKWHVQAKLRSHQFWDGSDISVYFHDFLLTITKLLWS